MIYARALWQCMHNACIMHANGRAALRRVRYGKRGTGTVRWPSAYGRCVQLSSIASPAH